MRLTIESHIMENNNRWLSTKNLTHAYTMDVAMGKTVMLTG